MPWLPAAVALATLLAQSPAPGEPSGAVAAAEAKAASGDLAGAAADYRALLAAAPAQRTLLLYRLASVERRLGDEAGAVGHAVEAADRLRAEGRLADAADALNLAAIAEIDAGRYATAAARLEPALGWSSGAGDWPRHAEQLTNLGNAYFFVGRYDDAAKHYALAHTVATKHAGQPWAARRLAVVSVNQAALFQRLGHYGEALAVYRRLEDDGAGLPPVERAQLLVNEGALFRRLGDPYKALDAYDRALADFVNVGSTAGQVTVLTNRGIVQALDLGRPAAAVADFTAAAAAAQDTGFRREELLARLYRGETELRAGDHVPARTDFEAALTSAIEVEAREEQWKALYGVGRAALAAGDTALARAALDRAIGVVDGLRERLAVPATRAEFFQDKRELYDARIALGLASDRPAELFALIEQSRARGWRDRLKLDAVSLAGVQARLTPDTVLLAYWWSPANAAVVRVTRTQAAVTPLTVTSAQITALTEAMRGADARAWNAAAEALGRALLPAGMVDGAAHVIVVPDGPLGAVPFEVLTIDGVPLVTQAAVSYLPTAALLRGPAAETRGWRPPWTRQLAAFGDPLPGADAWNEANGELRLAASAAEVRDISRALGGRHDLFLGAANRKSALLAALQPAPPVLHLATHGAADLVAGERSRLLFSPADSGGPSESLFLREVYDLPLDGVDLAVLSACETERGPDVRGEGVQGFSRGLLAAGARRAVTTLWRVPDVAAAELMRVFYAHLQQGQPADVALAEAKRAMLASGTLAHPHHWAAFVLTGAADPLPRALRWRDVAGVALVVTGALAAIVAWRGRRHQARVAR